MQNPNKGTKKEFLELTKAVWQPNAPRLLVDEDAREIAENIVGFFRILQEWESKESIKDSS